MLGPAPLKRWISLALLGFALGITACRVQQHGSNDNKNVKIETPFGDMKVKTNNAVVESDIGLAVYPGSALVKQDKNNAVDLDLSFREFHIRARGATYYTPDSPEKIKDYYRKELAQYGDVIECKGRQAVGKPSRTREGLACSDNGTFSVSNTTRNPDLELKAGGKTNQHVVAIVKDSEGTKFGLVALELPNLEKESN